MDMMDSSQFDNLQSNASRWTLANDSQLCAVLEDLSKRVMERAECMNSRLERIVKNIGKLDAGIDNLNCAINLQASTKFIEQKVAEETSSQPGPVVSDVKTRTMEQRQSETLSCITSAVTNGLSLLGSQFEKVSIQFPDEIVSDENFKPEPQFQPKDPYASCALPIIIGSSDFYSKPYKELFDHSFFPSTSPALNKLFNDSSLLPSTSMVQEQRLLDHPGPSTSTPLSLNAPVSLSDSVLEPTRNNIIQADIPPVPDMSNFGKLTRDQNEPTPTVRRDPAPPKTANPFMSQSMLEVTEKSTSKLFDESESETDDDDIFAQAKRSVMKKPVMEDSLSRKSVISEDLKQSSTAMMDSGKVSPISQKTQEPGASMNGFRPPTLSDVIAASARLKKNDFDRDSAKSAGVVVSPVQEIKGNIPVSSDSLSRDSMVKKTFNDGKICKTASVNENGNSTSHDKADSGTGNSPHISKLVNELHADDFATTTSETFGQKLEKPLKISQIGNDSNVAVDKSHPNANDKLMFDKNLEKEEKKENSIRKKKTLPFASKQKSIFDSDSDTDDLFTVIKKPSSQNHLPVVKSAASAVKIVEKKSEVPKHIGKPLVKKNLFSDQSDDDSLFFAKPAAQKLSTPKTDQKGQSAAQFGGESERPLAPETEKSILSADQTTFEEKELSAESQPITLLTKVLLDTEPKIENSVAKIGFKDSTPLLDPFNIPPELSEKISTLPDKEVQENGEKTQLLHKDVSFESVSDKPPEIPQQFSGKSIPDTSDWSHESEDSDSDMSLRGKLATSAFANKLNATLTKPPPPGGVKLFPTTPKSSEERIVSTSPKENSTTKVTSPTVIQTKTITPESTTKLFDDHPQLLTSALKGRVKGPVRRLPKKMARTAEPEGVKHTDAFPSSATAIDSKNVLCQTSVIKPACPRTETERRSSVTNVTPSPVCRKESSGSIRRKISITSTSVKDATAKSTLSTCVTSKKSIFDSESSDDDLFKKKSTVVIKKIATVGTKSKESSKPPPATTGVKESNSVVTKAPSAKIPVKKSLFDDSDDDLDLFQKK